MWNDSITRVSYPAISREIGRCTHKIEEAKDLDPLMERIGDAHYVLLGEASHGTHDYYTWRAMISKRLIEEKGFSFIAVEGDWPDCYRLNRFIKGYPDAGSSAREVLQEFNRWPTWMWANWEIVALSEWLKDYNAGLSADKRVGFYGLDVYSLWESMEAIVKYLEKKDPNALRAAKDAFECFEPYGRDEGRSYARATSAVPLTCEAEVVDLLREIRHKMPTYNTDPEAVFSVEQNALIAVNAERYYRAMISSGPESWNIRDRHMMETLGRLMQYHGKKAKCIVWEHNTHIGDATATDMARQGMVNIGQLTRERNTPEDVVLVGFASYMGTVIAGKSWGAPMRKMPVPPAPDDSWEGIFHHAGKYNQLIIFNEMEHPGEVTATIGHRAIGVVYHPEWEQYGNYVPTILPQRYDAMVYLDHTEALHPLHIKPDGHQMPETYPWGV